MSLMRVTVLHPYTSFKFVGLHDRKIWRIFLSALIGLVSLTFDLSIYKLGHGSPVSWASFLPIFGFLNPSTIDL